MKLKFKKILLSTPSFQKWHIKFEADQRKELAVVVTVHTSPWIKMTIRSASSSKSTAINITKKNLNDNIPTFYFVTITWIKWSNFMKCMKWINHVVRKSWRFNKNQYTAEIWVRQFEFIHYNNKLIVPITNCHLH